MSVLDLHGARVAGLGTHAGKTGSVIAISRPNRIHVLWDAGGRSWLVDGPNRLWERLDADALSAEQLLAYNLRRLLEVKGISEAEFAKAIGIPGKSYIAAMNLRGLYLSDHAKWPKGARLTAMAKALGVPRSELFREPEECRAATAGPGDA